MRYVAFLAESVRQYHANPLHLVVWSMIQHAVPHYYQLLIKKALMLMFVHIQSA